VQRLADAVLRYIRQQNLFKAGDRVGVAVSGGTDSTALLRLLLELRKDLGIVLSVVHFNHKLRGADADLDEEFVRGLAQKHGLVIHCGSQDVRQYASQNRLSIEAAARKLRYAYFKDMLSQRAVNRVATAHTLDDQAETVMLRITRGAGTRGLAGIHPVVSIAGEHSIVRPLLSVRRKDLESYLTAIAQTWREDMSNRDLRNARNRVRHGILPRLERHLNPSVRETLASVAEIARAEEEYWQGELQRVMPVLWDPSSKSIAIPPFLGLSLASQRRVIRAAGEPLGLRLEFEQVEQILSMTGAHAQASAAVALPHGWVACRERSCLRFRPGTETEHGNHEYNHRLAVPGEVRVPLAGISLQAIVIGPAQATADQENLFDFNLLGKELLVRNWHAGDRFWPAHTKAPKKVKELLTERHLSGDERKHWPVIVSGEELIWVRGFRPPAHLRPKNGAVVLIRETPLCESGGAEMGDDWGAAQDE
jgi:tRNA(Ile)-lysidine synthase